MTDARGRWEWVPRRSRAVSARAPDRGAHGVARLRDGTVVPAPEIQSHVDQPDQHGHLDQRSNHRQNAAPDSIPNTPTPTAMARSKSATMDATCRFWLICQTRRQWSRLLKVRRAPNRWWNTGRDAGLPPWSASGAHGGCPRSTAVTVSRGLGR